jgi:hypothetical protein
LSSNAADFPLPTHSKCDKIGIMKEKKRVAVWIPDSWDIDKLIGQAKKQCRHRPDIIAHLERVKKTASVEVSANRNGELPVV